jgi:hypothetical protein
LALSPAAVIVQWRSPDGLLNALSPGRGRAVRSWIPFQGAAPSGRPDTIPSTCLNALSVRVHRVPGFCVAALSGHLRSHGQRGFPRHCRRRRRALLLSRGRSATESPGRHRYDRRRTGGADGQAFLGRAADEFSFMAPHHEGGDGSAMYSLPERGGDLSMGEIVRRRADLSMGEIDRRRADFSRRGGSQMRARTLGLGSRVIGALPVGSGHSDWSQTASR